MSIPFEKSASCVNTQTPLDSVKEPTVFVGYRSQMNNVTPQSIEKPPANANHRDKIKDIIRLVRVHLDVIASLSIRASKGELYNGSEARCSIIKKLLYDIHTEAAKILDHEDEPNT